MSPEKRRKFIAALKPDEYAAINWFYVFYARDKQLPPPGDWFCWLIRSGRGFGKTRTGAEWVIEQVRNGCKRIALVGQTKADVRDTMVEVEESSILKIAPPEWMPDYQPSKRRLTWANGAVATIYSGDEPDQLRGPQHEKAWVDELAKFKYPGDTWDNLEFGLRLGENPQVCCTTTPRPIPIIKALVADPDTVDVKGSTYENIENLSPMFIKRVVKKYENTRLGKQELYGLILDDDPRALWNRDMLESTRVNEYPDLHSIVVGVDPHATTGQTGIIVGGVANVDNEAHFYVLDDQTPPEGVKPSVWASAAVAAYNRNHADRIIGEINNGGDMVENTIRTVDGGRHVPYKTVRATRGKHVRAQPVSSLWEQGRAHMVGYFADLEDQLCSWVPGDVSPDRLDAMVWAATELVVGTLPATWDDVANLGRVEGYVNRWE